jgi:hypothetical protein
VIDPVLGCVENYHSVVEVDVRHIAIAVGRRIRHSFGPGPGPGPGPRPGRQCCNTALLNSLYLLYSYSNGLYIAIIYGRQCCITALVHSYSYGPYIAIIYG